VVGNHFWFFLSLGFIPSYGTSLFSWLILIDVYLCYFEKMKIKNIFCVKKNVHLCEGHGPKNRFFFCFFAFITS
jgi:hypothetical protein